MKRLFSTPKKAVISVICMAAAIAVICVTAVKSTLITKAEARDVALRDADLSEAEASALRTKLEFDDGRFQYEVDFYSNGTEYEYLIQAKDGEIIARDIEGGENGNRYRQNPTQDAGNQPTAAENGPLQPQQAPESQPAAARNDFLQPQEAPENQLAATEGSSLQQGKTLDEAKAAALKDAGLSESDVTFKKAEFDHDHGMQTYDIEFYTSDTEYDYKISASDGTILEKSLERFQIQAGQTGNAADSPNNYIGIDNAKRIALNHANLSESDVRFAKSKLENDDKGPEYEIEFYSGRTEYDYTIDAVSGDIIEYDVDYD